MLSRTLAALALVAFASMVAAQAVVDTSQPQQLSEAVSVGYVMVPFTVLGGHNSPITDLGSAEVSLLVDGVAVRSDLFEKSQNAPVSFTILVDGSGSMALAGKLDAARAAVATLLARRVPGDDYSLYVFDDREVHELVPFTDKPDSILMAMRQIKPYGKTAFFDALATMPERSRLGKNPTRAIILLSDGIDNASKMTRPQLAAMLEGIAIPIFPLGLREPGELKFMKMTDETSDLALLNQVAMLTGGRLFLGNHAEQLASAVDHIENDLRAQYLIGFTPTGKGAVKYRRISLKVAGRVRSVRVRAGYRGTEPPVLTSSNERKRS
jgi:Ca-activated chloride channel family protein